MTLRAFLRQGLPEGTRRTCPHCGALVITEDATKTIHHAWPECEKFRELMKGSTSVRLTVAELDDDGGDDGR